MPATASASAQTAAEKKVAPSGNLSTLNAGSAITIAATRTMLMVAANRECEKIFILSQASYLSRFSCGQGFHFGIDSLSSG